MSGVVDVILPSDQAEGTRSQILAWLKAVGDTVRENEPLLEIETDKVTVEVPAPCGGVLREILKEAPAEVEPGAVLGRIERSASRVPIDREAHAQAPAARQAAAQTAPRQVSASSMPGPLRSPG